MRTFENEKQFRKAVMNALKSRGFTSIPSGTGSSIDEYIIHINNPFQIISLIDFKYQASRNDGNNEPVNLRPDQVKSLSSIWREKFLFVIHTSDDKFMIINHKGILPLISDYKSKTEKYRTGNSINLSDTRINSDMAKVAINEKNIMKFEKFGQMIESLVSIFHNFINPHR